MKNTLKPYNIKDILSVIDEYEIAGNFENLRISNATIIEEATNHSICWIKSSRSDEQEILSNTKSRLIICDEKIKISKKLLRNKCFIITRNPKSTFLTIVAQLFVELKPKIGIHPTALVNEEARIGKNVWIGPFCIVGKVKIGDNTKINSNCIIEDDSIVGDNVVIHHHVIIGSDGFGFVRNSQSKLEKFYHIGNVVIEADVEIFPFVNVDRGTLAETRIKRGTKIDHYCHIGHNSEIGEDSLITAGTVLCGGSRVGDRTWTGVNSIIKEKVKIGNDVVLGLGSVVTKNVPDGEIWLGSPAKERSQFMKMLEKIK